VATSKAKLENLSKRLRELFNQAKAKDEFEYCCALLRIRGMEGAG
jgi:hypothetical protein